MNKLDILNDIANEPSIGKRLPLYAAAMQLGLVTYQDIQAVIKDAEVKPVARTAKKAAAKKVTT